jgi:hypothetical protein
MAFLHRVLSLLIATVAPSAAQIEPQYAQNLTVYHLNPATAGAIPLNMDTGDARGDLYFYLGEFLLPIECSNATKEQRSHFDCSNPERVDPNLVVTKVEMEIDSRTTTYSACNLCNGTDPFTHKPCEVGTYTCDCFSQHGGNCDVTKLGNESIAEHFAPHVTAPKCAAALKQYCGTVKDKETECGLCVMLHKRQLMEAACNQYDYFDFCPSSWHHCDADSPAWECWEENIPRKTGGFWYSTLAEGQCNKTSATGSCGWKVLSTKTVNNTCLKDKLMTRVESSSPSCFKGCGSRNTTSTCWIGCFFDALLGPEAAHSTTVKLGGLPISEVEKTWADAFLPEANGGCAPLDIPTSWLPPSNVLVV